LSALIPHLRRIEPEHLLGHFIIVKGIGQRLPCMHGR
jgi:hypothetical protein